MKKRIVTAIIIASISSAFAQYSQSVAIINPWTIKYFKDPNLANIMGQRCVAVQYANGAEIDITADPDRPNDQNTIQIFSSFAEDYDSATVSTENTFQFDHFLNEYLPQRHGSSGVFKLNNIVGKQLFITFYLGRFAIGRYSFELGNLQKLSTYLHQPSCVLQTENEPKISLSQYSRIHIGQTRNEVEKILGAPDQVEEFEDSGGDYADEWTSVYDEMPIAIEFNGNNKVIMKVHVKSKDQLITFK